MSGRQPGVQRRSVDMSPVTPRERVGDDIERCARLNAWKTGPISSARRISDMDVSRPSLWAASCTSPVSSIATRGCTRPIRTRAATSNIEADGPTGFARACAQWALRVPCCRRKDLTQGSQRWEAGRRRREPLRRQTTSGHATALVIRRRRSQQQARRVSGRQNLEAEVHRLCHGLV